MRKRKREKRRSKRKPEVPVYRTNKRIKITGFIIEISKYGKDFLLSFHPRKKNEIEIKRVIEELTEEARRSKNMKAKKNKIIDLINSNAYQWHDNKGKIYIPIFTTLTFAENITDLDFANNEFKKFIKRLGYEIKGQKYSFLKYIAVVEFQERGAIHYHIIFFNLPYMENIYDRFRELWTHGSSNIKAVRSIRNIGFYLAKYLTKSGDSDRLEFRKHYFVSNGLKKPDIIWLEEVIDMIKNIIPEESKTNKRPIRFQTDYLGEIERNYYNLKKYPEIMKQIQEEFIGKYI
jgi:hypothetical protein